MVIFTLIFLGPPTNNSSDEQQNGGMQKPKLKPIARDMPKWQRDKILKENERIKVNKCISGFFFHDTEKEGFFKHCKGNWVARFVSCK